jgi:hypothetical protein
VLRVDVPEDQLAVAGPYILATIGSPALLAARKAYGSALYDFQCDTSLSFREREAIRMWVGFFLSCNVCKAWRPATHPIAGRPPTEEQAATISEGFYKNILNYKSWDGYSEREKLAIEFVERYATDLQGVREDEGFWARLKRNFSQLEIGDLGIFAGDWVSSAMTLKMLGFEGAVCEIEGANTADDLVRRAVSV